MFPGGFAGVVVPFGSPLPCGSRGWPGPVSSLVSGCLHHKHELIRVLHTIHSCERFLRAL